jgi:hypothetical protein
LIAQEYFEESVHLEQPVLLTIEPQLAGYYQTFCSQVPPLMDVSIHLFVLFFLTDKFLFFLLEWSPYL